MAMELKEGIQAKEPIKYFDELIELKVVDWR